MFEVTIEEVTHQVEYNPLILLCVLYTEVEPKPATTKTIEIWPLVLSKDNYFQEYV